MNCKQELLEISTDNNQDLESFNEESSEIEYMKIWNPGLNSTSWIKKELYDLKTEQFDFEKPSDNQDLESLTEECSEIQYVKIRHPGLNSTSWIKRELFDSITEEFDFEKPSAQIELRSEEMLGELEPTELDIKKEHVDNINVEEQHGILSALNKTSKKNTESEQTLKCASKASLKSRLKDHLKVKPLGSYKAANKSNSGARLKGRAGGRPRKCKICDFTASSKLAVTEHMTTHTATERRQRSRKKYCCIVPQCGNTSQKTPDKLFIYGPRTGKSRNLWIKAVRRKPSEFFKTSPLLVCEDHFDLETDMENYVRFKLMGCPKKLKAGVVPHVFECQKGSASRNRREISIKRARRQLVEEILSSASSGSDVVESATVANDNSRTMLSIKRGRRQLVRKISSSAGPVSPAVANDNSRTIQPSASTTKISSMKKVWLILPVPILNTQNNQKLSKTATICSCITDSLLHR